MSTSIVNDVNILLADSAVIYQTLRNFHWNVKGSRFIELHAHFEELYTEWAVIIDDLAELILTLRSRPLSTLSEFLKVAKIKEPDAKKVDNAEKMLEHLVAIFKEFIGRTTQAVNNMNGDTPGIYTARSFLEELIGRLNKQLWMLVSLID
jgi:starvation-inducible DNA-binding protein